MSSTNTLLAARSIALNSDPSLVRKLVLLGQSPRFEHHDAKSALNDLRATLPPYTDLILVNSDDPSIHSGIGGTPFVGEVGVRASIEPLISDWCRNTAHAIVWVDASCLVEPHWLRPLVRAVSLDPYAVAVPDLVRQQQQQQKTNHPDQGLRAAPASAGALGGASADAAPPSGALSKAGLQFDWALNAHYRSAAHPESGLLPAPASGLGAGGSGSGSSGRGFQQGSASSAESPRVGAASLAVLAAHSDWWHALGGFTRAVEAGLGTDFWPSSLPPLPHHYQPGTAGSGADGNEEEEEAAEEEEEEHAVQGAELGEMAASAEAHLPPLPLPLASGAGGAGAVGGAGGVAAPSSKYPMGAGAPSLELSMRVWGCGGTIHIVPCSVVQQQATAGLHQWSAKEADAAAVSALRTAELWLGDKAPLVWAAHGTARDSEAAMASRGVDSEAREMLEHARQRLGEQGQCQSGDWTLHHVDSALFHPPLTNATPPPPLTAKGSQETTSMSLASSPRLPSAAAAAAAAAPAAAALAAAAPDRGEVLVAASQEAKSSGSGDGGVVALAPGGGGGGGGGRGLGVLHADTGPGFTDLSARMAKVKLPVVEDWVDVFRLATLRRAGVEEAVGAAGGGGAAAAAAAGGAGGEPFPGPAVRPAAALKAVCDASGPGSRDNDAKLLAHVKVASPSEVEAAEDRAVASGKLSRPARIMCLSYCVAKKHATAISAVRRTWGNKCDGFAAMSDLTDAALPALNVPHEGKEEYDNIWQKVRSIWVTVYQRTYDDFDWWYIGGDDLYVIVENLRLYLHSDQVLDAALDHAGSNNGVQKPLFLGRRFAQGGDRSNMFNSGGAGYLLNKAALKLLATNALDNPLCQPHLHGFWEDVQVASCLKKTGKVLPFDTRDDQGRERFHPFTPGNHLTYRISPKNPDWYAKYSVDLKEGLDCCSDRSVAFHYVKENLMPKLHALLYDCRAS